MTHGGTAQPVRGWRLLLAAGWRLSAAVLIVGYMLGGGRQPAARADTPVPMVNLRGEGSWDPYREMRAWQDNLYGPSGAVNVSYLANGDYFGRQDLLSGSVDFALSGEPFTSGELQQLPHGSSDLIDAPMFVGAVVFPVVPFTQSYPGFLVQRVTCDPNDPNDPQGGGECYPPPATYTGKVKLDPHSLASMTLNYTQPAKVGDAPPNHWDNPEVVANWNLPLYGQATDFQQPFLATQFPPVPYLRSEPSSTNLYVQEYAKLAAPEVWAGLKAESPGFTFEPITEKLGRVLAQTRPGVDEQMKAIEALSAPGGSAPGGFIAAAPPGGFNELVTDVPQYKPVLATIRNAAGEWVDATPDTIDAAVNAGLDTPLYATTNPVSGAYPLVYVDHMYMPAHGLPMDKIEALAATVRYLATAGQDVDAPIGDGRLPATLVDRALAAANQLVLSNCTAPTETVISSSDPGPYAPASALNQMQAIGPMLHCAAAPAPSTTTTAPVAAPTTTTTGGSAAASTAAVADLGVSAEAPLPPVGSSVSVPSELSAASQASSSSGTTSTPASQPAAATGSPRARGVLAVSRLPMAPPSPTGGPDRLTVILCGGLLMLLFRAPFRWLMAKARR